MEIKTLTSKIQNYIGESYDKKIVVASIPLIRERIKKLSDYIPLTEFLFSAPKAYDIPLEKYKNTLIQVGEELKLLNEFIAQKIGEAMMDVAKNSGYKNSEFFQMLRVAITGRKVSPPLNESMEILGKEECLKRISAI